MMRDIPSSPVLRFVLVFLACSTTYTTTISTSSQEEESREPADLIVSTNYGVIFHKVGTIINGVSNYKRTFGVHVPQLKWVDVERIPCVTDKDKLQYCQGVNAMIDASNNRIGPEFENVQKQVDMAVNLGTGRQQGAHSISKRDANDHKDSYYCSDEYMTTHDGFWSKIGKFFTDLTGAPNWDDIKKVDQHTCSLIAQIARNEDQIVADKKVLGSVSQSFDQRSEALGDALEESYGRVNETTLALKEQTTTSLSNLSNISNQLRAIELAQFNVFSVKKNLQEHEDIARGMLFAAKGFVRGMARLSEGYISTDLVTLHQVVNLIIHIQEEVLPAYKDVALTLALSNPAAVYNLKNVVYTVIGKEHRPDKMVVISINIPLTAGRGPLTIYRVDRTHLGAVQNHTASTRIDNLPPFIAISHDGPSTVELTAAQYATCRGDIIKTCSGLEGLTNIDKHTSCSNALILDDAASIIEKCDVSYETAAVGSKVVTVSDGVYLVHMEERQGHDWTVQCQNRNDNDNIPACNTCIVRLGCGCSLDGGDFLIPRRVSGCDLAPPDEKGVQIVYPTNLHVYKHVYSFNDIRMVGGTRPSTSFTAEDEAAVLYKVRELNIDNTLWNETVQQLNIYSANLSLLLKANDEQADIYESKANYVLGQSRDVNDVYEAQYNDLLDKLGGRDVPSLLGKDSTLGKSSSYWIASITCLVFGLYFLCRK